MIVRSPVVHTCVRIVRLLEEDTMNLGIIGSGKIGGTAARLFVHVGHEVAIGNTRGPASLAALVEDLGTKARAATIDEACAFGEVVLVAIPFGKYQTLPVKPSKAKWSRTR
jgi:predicted dinucleotide-binding enzyme